LPFGGTIWKAKKDAGKSLKANIEEVIVPQMFKSIEKDLVLTHNIKKINYGSLNVKI